MIGIASAIIGDNIGYLLGRKFGRDVLEAPGPFAAPARMLIARRRPLLRAARRARRCSSARWVALVRVAAAWLAGINHMPFREFFFWNALGGITWGITFGLVGYFGGHAAANVITEFGPDRGGRVRRRAADRRRHRDHGRASGERRTERRVEGRRARDAGPAASCCES